MTAPAPHDPVLYVLIVEDAGIYTDDIYLSRDEAENAMAEEDAPCRIVEYVPRFTMLPPTRTRKSP